MADIVNEHFFMDVLTKIVRNVGGYVPARGRRIDDLDKYLYTYSLLCDDYSRSLYARILARMLASEFLDANSARRLFPIWDEEFSKQYELNKKTVVLPDLKHPNDAGSAIIFPETFYTPAYSYKELCDVRENDIVIDAGAWIGDTAYVFSKRMKGTGEIYSFEPMPQNYAMLDENASKIPNLKIYNCGLGKEKGILKFIFPEWEAASGSSRYDENGQYEVNMTTLDSFVKENQIERVDFIKADIEGAECDMLLGAADTIRRFHPKLAICIYHRGQVDHYKVPNVIMSIRQDYEFYLEAFQNGLNETVLFAVPVKQIPMRKECKFDVRTIKELYISVYERLRNDYRIGLISEFNRLLDKYLIHHFDWITYDNEQRLPLKSNGDIHYKLSFRWNCISVELICVGFARYQDEHKECISELFEVILRKCSGYKTNTNQYGISLRKEMSYDFASPDNLACNMAVLIKYTLIPLWKNGLVDPECVKPLLYKEGSSTTAFPLSIDEHL